MNFGLITETPKEKIVELLVDLKLYGRLTMIDYKKIYYYFVNNKLDIGTDLDIIPDFDTAYIVIMFYIENSLKSNVSEKFLELAGKASSEAAFKKLIKCDERPKFIKKFVETHGLISQLSLIISSDPELYFELVNNY